MVLLGDLPPKVPLCLDDHVEPQTTGFIHSHQSNDPGSALANDVSRASVLGILKHGADALNSMFHYFRDGLTDSERDHARFVAERRQILLLRLQNAETLKQWRKAAKELDVLLDHEAWKADTTTPIRGFNAVLINEELRKLDEARTNRDIKTMLYLVRTSLCRNLGGMDDIQLYLHSYVGTKNLIDRYVDSTVETIRVLVEISKHSLPQGLATKDILQQVVNARQAFGRSALLLSGGATFGMNHIGVIKALFEAKLLPRIISGASAGSIVCSVLCTRTDQELPSTLACFPYGDLAVFEDKTREDSVLDRVRRLLTHGAWIDIGHLTRVMRGLLGDLTFQEAYNRTRRILNIPVSSASVYELPRLLNYVTAPSVLIWSAVAASCSVPVLFSAAELLVKDPLTGVPKPWNPTPQAWIDGSVDNDLPMTRLAEIFNINHFIVSQVNPHVIPFIAKDEALSAHDVGSQNSMNSGPGWIYSLTSLAKTEVMHRMHVLADMGIATNLMTKCRSVLSQKYSGDITILPSIEYKDFSRILKNPTSEFMIQACLSGERATWPKLSRVRNHCAIELELDAAVQSLRAKVVFSPSQTNLRRMGTLETADWKLQDKSNMTRLVRTTSLSQEDGKHSNQPTDDEEDSGISMKQTRASASSSPSRPRIRVSRSYLSMPLKVLPRQRVASCGAGPESTFLSRDQHSLILSLGGMSRQRGSLRTGVSSPTDMSHETTDAEECLKDVSSESHLDTGSATPTTPMRDDTAPKNVDGAAEIDIDHGRDWFTHSQPVTTGRDWLDATSPRAKRNGFR